MPVNILTAIQQPGKVVAIVIRNFYNQWAIGWRTRQEGVLVYGYIVGLQQNASHIENIYTHVFILPQCIIRLYVNEIVCGKNIEVHVAVFGNRTRIGNYKSKEGVWPWIYTGYTRRHGLRGIELKVEYVCTCRQWWYLVYIHLAANKCQHPEAMHGTPIQVVTIYKLLLGFDIAWSIREGAIGSEGDGIGRSRVWWRYRKGIYPLCPQLP